MSRYDSVNKIKNDKYFYNDFFKSRNVKFINHYGSKQYVYPTDEQFKTLDMVRHVWKIGDAYWKLSQEYYGNPEYWWVIGYVNKTPVDSDLQPGDIIEIPTKLEDTLRILEG
jgi:nucleoid-associated protein YgaU